jgi:hypothetical protein
MPPEEKEFARAHAGSASTSTRPTRDQRRLEVFVGNWQMEGQQFDSLFGGQAEVTAEESFEWLPGGMFLIHRLVGRLGAAEMACIEVIDADRMPGGYRVHTFYNDGRSQDWLLTENDDNWTISADWSLPDGSKQMVRCTQRFGKAGTTRKGIWEVSTNGKWKTFWEVTARKVS